MDKTKDKAIELLQSTDEVECSKKLRISLNTLLSWMHESEFSSRLAERTLICEDATRRICKSVLLNAVKSINALIISNEIDPKLLIDIIKHGDGFKDVSGGEELSELIKRVISDEDNS